MRTAGWRREVFEYDEFGIMQCQIWLKRRQTWRTIQELLAGFAVIQMHVVAMHVVAEDPIVRRDAQAISVVVVHVALVTPVAGVTHGKIIAVDVATQIFIQIFRVAQQLA